MARSIAYRHGRRHLRRRRHRRGGRPGPVARRGRGDGAGRIRAGDPARQGAEHAGRPPLGGPAAGRRGTAARQPGQPPRARGSLAVARGAVRADFSPQPPPLATIALQNRPRRAHQATIQADRTPETMPGPASPRTCPDGSARSLRSRPKRRTYHTRPVQFIAHTNECDSLPNRIGRTPRSLNFAALRATWAEVWPWWGKPQDATPGWGKPQDATGASRIPLVCLRSVPFMQGLTENVRRA